MNDQTKPQSVIYVYVLIDPRNNEVRYVGVTNNPKRRLEQHIEESKRKKNHRACWTKSLLRDGLKPIMTTIDETDEDNWAQREIAWIAHYRAMGCDLVNSSDGGRGQRGYVTSEETRRILSEANRGENNPMYGVSGENNPMYGKTHSEETRRRMSELSSKKRPIIQYTKGGVFIQSWDSANQASIALKIVPSSITQCCKRYPNNHTAGGYIWRYADDPLPSSELTQPSFDFDE